MSPRGQQAKSLGQTDTSVSPPMARTNNMGGTSRPMDFAVFRLITNSNLVACTAGRSAGLGASFGEGCRKALL